MKLLTPLCILLLVLVLVSHVSTTDSDNEDEPLVVLHDMIVQPSYLARRTRTPQNSVTEEDAGPEHAGPEYAIEDMANLLTGLNINFNLAELSVTSAVVQILSSLNLSWPFHKNKFDLEAALKEIKIIQDEDDECAICLENQKESVAVPCGHFAFCKECVLKLGGSCPLCREEVYEYIDRDRIPNQDQNKEI